MSHILNWMDWAKHPDHLFAALYAIGLYALVLAGLIFAMPRKKTDTRADFIGGKICASIFLIGGAVFLVASEVIKAARDHVSASDQNNIALLQIAVAFMVCRGAAFTFWITHAVASRKPSAQ